MAQLPDRAVQDLVHEIADEIDDAANIRVQEDLLNIALTLPIEHATTCAKKVARWVPTVHGMLADQIAALIVRLARGGQLHDAFDLGTAFFTTHDSVRNNQQFLWDQGKLSEILPVLVEIGGMQTLEWVMALLDAELEKTVGTKVRPKRDDSSYIWRPKIADDEDNFNHEPRDLLVTAVRDAAQHLVSQDATSLPKVIECLETMEWGVCRRIALYLLANPVAPIELVAARLLDAHNFDDYKIEHEYTALMNTGFPRLKPEDQRAILDRISAGPDDLDDRRVWHKEQTEQDLSTDEEHRIIKSWQAGHLFPIKHALPADWQQTYAEITKEFGEPEPLQTGGVLIGPASPKTQDELASMTPQDLIAYLRTWEPPERKAGIVDAPSREGLAQYLRTLIAQAPEAYAQLGPTWIGLDPSYIHALLAGLENSAKEQRIFTWSPLFPVLMWIPTQQVAGTPDSTMWQWTTRTLAEFLSTGLQQGPGEIPFEHREAIWAVIEVLTKDPQPTAAQEGTEDVHSRDPYSTAINSVRGQAINTAIHYGLWVHRHKPGATFDDMPELRALLDQHLDDDPSPAIRSVYGRWFPWLTLLDTAWTTAHVAIIFSENNAVLRDAAWNTYITMCRPYDEPVRILQAEYDRAIDRIGTISNPSQKVDEALTKHLVLLYGRDHSTWARDALLTHFYERASAALRAHVIDFAGRVLTNTQRKADWVTRCQELWEYRRDIAAQHPRDHKDELAGFGWWVTSGAFEDTWMLEQLAVVLQLAGYVDHDNKVMEKLSQLAAVYPQRVQECLKMLIDGHREQWHIYAWRKNLRAILTVTLQDATTRAGAIELINRLAANGHMEFADLLP